MAAIAWDVAWTMTPQWLVHRKWSGNRRLTCNTPDTTGMLPVSVCTVPKAAGIRYPINRGHGECTV